MKTAQSGLTAPVRIAQRTLEHQELVDILRQRLGSKTSHAGTGSAMARNRSVATLKYADVESGSLCPRISPIILGAAPSSSWRQAWVCLSTCVPINGAVTPAR